MDIFASSEWEVRARVRTFLLPMREAQVRVFLWVTRVCVAGVCARVGWWLAAIPWLVAEHG